MNPPEIPNASTAHAGPRAVEKAAPPPRRSRRLAGCLANVALLTVTLAIALVVAEWGVRHFGGDRFHPLVPSGERGVFWQYDETLGWRHRPGQKGRFAKPGVFDTAVSINSSGFRGPEHPPQPQAGVERIVVLGDSVSWGYGVEDADVFTERLAALRPAVEPVNLAVSGYGTDQEALLLERYGMSLHPSLVLLQVCENDFTDVTRDQVHGIYPKPRFRLDAGELRAPVGSVPPVSLVDRTLFWLETRSWLWRLVNLSRPGSAAVTGLKRAAWRAGLSRAAPPDPPAELGEQLVVGLLDRCRATARAGGADFAILLAAPMAASHRQAVLSYCARARVEVVDLAEIFARTGREGAGPLFLPNDLHWTRRGHDVVARRLAEWLDGRPRGAVSAPPAPAPTMPSSR